MRRLYFSLFLMIIFASAALTQHPGTGTPKTKVAAGRAASAGIREGGRLFAKNCSACHGDTGKGGRGPDLTSGQWKHGGSDGEIIRNTIKGIPGTQMPAIPVTEA